MFKHIFIYSFFILIALVGFFGNFYIVTNFISTSVIDISYKGVIIYASSDADCPGKWDSEFGCPGDLDKAIDKVAKDNAAEEAKKVVTIVSEKVPGATCVCIAPGAGGEMAADGMGPPTPGTGEAACGNITTRKYKCTTEAGMTGFQKVFAQMIRFVINIVMLLGVLAVVGLGIAWSFAGGDDMKMKSTLKTWAINLVIGFIILFMFRYILQFLAPWIYK